MFARGEASYFLFLAIASIVLAVLGWFCKSKLSKWSLWTVATLLLLTVLADAYHVSIARQCTGSFLKGIYCPPELVNPFEFRLASALFSFSLVTILALVYLGGPVLLFALLWEIRKRSVRR